MSETNRSAVILAAVNASGVNDGADYMQRVIQNAKQISLLLADRSPVNKAITQLEASKVFAANVVATKREKSSNRVVVELETKPSTHHLDGKEAARTERIDNPIGLDVATRCKNLIGHRVLIWVEVEEYNNGTGKVRIVRHVEDRGEAFPFED